MSVASVDASRWHRSYVPRMEHRIADDIKWPCGMCGASHTADGFWSVHLETPVQRLYSADARRKAVSEGLRLLSLERLVVASVGLISAMETAEEAAYLEGGYPVDTEAAHERNRERINSEIDRIMKIVGEIAASGGGRTQGGDATPSCLPDGIRSALVALLEEDDLARSKTAATE